MFDFDGFKRIDDDHGHPVGDAVLVAVAADERLMARKRERRRREAEAASV